MRALRLGLALVVIGVALPLVCLPLAHGYQKSAGWLANIQQMSLAITPDGRDPEFREVSSLDPAGQRVSVKDTYGTNEMMLGFPDSMSNDDMEAAIRAFLPRYEYKQNMPKFMRFYGWTRHGVSVPFGYITSLGLVLAVAGLIVLAWNKCPSVAKMSAVEQAQKKWEQHTTAFPKMYLHRPVDRKNPKYTMRDFRRFDNAIALLRWNDDRIEIAKLETLVPRGGGPTRLVEFLKSLADEFQIPLWGHARRYELDKGFKSEELLTKEQLLNFYRKRGFTLSEIDSETSEISYTPKPRN